MKIDLGLCDFGRYVDPARGVSGPGRRALL